MKLFIIKSLKLIVLFILLLTIIIMIGSIDTETYDDQGLFSLIPVVVDSENGYSVIKYIEKSGFELFTECEQNKVNALLDKKEWDQSYVDNLLAEKKSFVDDVKKVVEHPYFQLPLEQFSHKFSPNYTYYKDVNKLILLKLENYLKNKQFERALLLLSVSIDFSQRVKKGLNMDIILYKIGNIMLYDTLEWVKEHQEQLYDNIKYNTLNDLMKKLMVLKMMGLSKL
ncbi:hypothetical protein [Zooshikella sp. RANM57]|uniref:hypothetical protein n=1 Tax=Zooshikella sp. RANM57 TaxID=3425863 RepID=UPI003D6EFD9B